ncbi:PREDICTED: uridine-cytidine kinase-like 1 isoform X2 [Priapulus caudatus]|uniref:Uridine kinase n=1 Tax=Priapulus caudatus TaxID=37621 RepID=A0ABM1DWV3_PRICU|nr:PREDICTED: uridine-cytidine kinase-like 1 isoform X2 [Priapulus caudatus]
MNTSDEEYVEDENGLEDWGSADDCDVIVGTQDSASAAKPPAGRSPGGRRTRVRTASTSKASPDTVDPVMRTTHRTIYTAGRPPWYDSLGQLKEAFVIGICGGSASGKTTVARKIIEELDVPWVVHLSMDSFYKNFTDADREVAARNEFNFDHPDAFDFELLTDTLKKLKMGKQVDVPIYNFNTHSRETYKKQLYGANVVIFEGILAFQNYADLLPLMDLKVFVDTDSDIRLARRLRRDISERGRELEGVLKQYNKFVKPAFEHYIAPSMAHADIIVPRGGENEIALNLIVRHVNTQLQQRGFKHRSKLACSHNGGSPPTSLHILENTPQVRGLHTFIRDKDLPRDQFIFYSERLMRLLIEYALSYLPFKDVVVDTPQGKPYEGRMMDTKKICGVSILRAGETMEPAISSVVKNVRLGKILIQTNLDTGEPELYYLRLPRNIKDYHVLLMDATVATGAAAMMAIRILLDHDVSEDQIMLLSLLMAESGVHSVAYAFPKVKIVTTAVDRILNDQFHIVPGIGNFGDRFFGTDTDIIVGTAPTPSPLHEL